MSSEERRKYWRERRHALRERRRAQGFCYQCGEVEVENEKQCNNCLEKQRRIQKNYAKRRKEEKEKNKEYYIAEEEHIVNQGCIHQWELDSHNGHWSNGICTKCGSTKQFANSLTEEEINTWGKYYPFKVQK